MHAEPPTERHAGIHQRMPPLSTCSRKSVKSQTYTADFSAQVDYLSGGSRAGRQVRSV